MPEGNTPTGAGQVPPAGAPQGQVPTDPQGTPTATGQVPVPQSGGDDLSPEQLRDALRKARDEAAKNRIDAKRLADLEKAESDRQAASLTETQRAAKERDDAVAALQAARSRIGASELKVAAQAAGIIDPDVAAALLGAKIEYDADGEPKNVTELVTGLKKDKPHLFNVAQPPRPPATSGGATNPGRQAGNGGLTLEMIEGMSNRERMARIGEIDAWYKARQQR